MGSIAVDIEPMGERQPSAARWMWEGELRGAKWSIRKRLTPHPRPHPPIRGRGPGSDLLQVPDAGNEGKGPAAKHGTRVAHLLLEKVSKQRKTAPYLYT